MSTEDKVWNTLKSQNPYSVYCRHNFWSGRCYEVGVRPMYVLAASPEEAKQFVQANLGLAEIHFRSKRTGPRNLRLIRLSETYKFQPRDIGLVKPIPGTMSIVALNRFGEWVRYNA